MADVRQRKLRPGWVLKANGKRAPYHRCRNLESGDNGIWWIGKQEHSCRFAGARCQCTRSDGCGHGCNPLRETFGKEVDYGFVGDVRQVNGTFLSDLIHKGVVPVMAPLTHDGKGGMLNTNADTIAGETAKALSGQFDVTLVYCFEKKGVLRDENDDNSVILQITPEEFKRYVAEGVIQGGMIPKLENSFEALDAGVSEVVITLASAINSDSGTRIKK